MGHTRPHQAATYALTLPVPPSANRWWRTFRGRMTLSSDARTYKVAVERLVTARLRREGQHLPLIPEGHAVTITMRWFREARRGDLDKRLGILIDALQGTLYANDSQVIELHAFRYDDAANPRVEVEVATA